MHRTILPVVSHSYVKDVVGERRRCTGPTRANLSRKTSTANVCTSRTEQFVPEWWCFYQEWSGPDCQQVSNKHRVILSPLSLELSQVQSLTTLYLCRLAPNSIFNPHMSPFGFGNYDINVIQIAVQNKNYEAIWFNKAKYLHLLCWCEFHSN